MTERPMSPQEEAHARDFLRDAREMDTFSVTMARKMLATIDKLRETVEQLRGNAA